MYLVYAISMGKTRPEPRHKTAPPSRGRGEPNSWNNKLEDGSNCSQDLYQGVCEPRRLLDVLVVHTVHF